MKALKILMTVIVIILVLAIVLVSVAMFYLTGFKTSPVLMTVNDNYVLKSSKLDISSTDSVDVKLNKLFSNSTSNYEVKLVPNITDKTSFDFYVNGNSYNFAGEQNNDYSLALDLVRSADGFTFDTTKLNLKTILATRYSGLIQITEFQDTSKTPYFNLVVTTGDGYIVYNIGLLLPTIEADDYQEYVPTDSVEFDKTEIIF